MTGISPLGRSVSPHLLTPKVTTPIIVNNCFFVKLSTLDTYRNSWYTSGMKEKTSFTLSPECRRLLRLLADRLGISQADVVEVCVREKAQREGIKLST